MDEAKRILRRLEEIETERASLLAELDSVRESRAIGDSGDSIFDYCVVSGKLGEQERQLRELEGRMQGKEGQLVLVLEEASLRWEYSQKVVASFSFKGAYLGVLSSERLFFSDRSYGIPMARHWRVGKDGVPSAVDGPVFMPSEDSRFSPIFGDLEVKTEAIKLLGWTAYARVLSALGREDQIPPE